MTANNLFKQLIEKAQFRFIPVYDLRDNSVYGYKIIKDFDAVGFPNKEEVYDFAFDEGILEFFLVKLQERVYQAAEELGYLNCKLFHTIRVNYIGDAYYFSSAMDRLSSKFHLKKENIIFELKGASDWKNLDQFLEAIEDEDDEEECAIMFKETPEFPLNINMIRYLDPSFVEAMSLESVKNLKEDKEVESKIIFKIPKDKNYSNEELLKAGVDLAYTL